MPSIGRICCKILTYKDNYDRVKAHVKSNRSSKIGRGRRAVKEIVDFMLFQNNSLRTDLYSVKDVVEMSILPLPGG